MLIYVFVLMTERLALIHNHGGIPQVRWWRWRVARWVRSWGMEFDGALNGAVTRRDAVAERGERTVVRWVRAGIWRPIWRTVLVRRGRETEPLTRVTAAVLAVGEPLVVSGAAALWLHGCLAAESCDMVEITVPRNREPRSRAGLRVRRRDSPPDDWEIIQGMPTLSLASALAEALCAKDRSLAFACVEQALVMAGSGADDLRRLVSDRLRERRGTRGVVSAEGLIDLATGMAESPPESETLLIISDAGLPIPIAQYEVPSISGRCLYRLDFAWPLLRIGLEYDGYLAHRDRRDEDRVRDEDLRRMGWLIIRVTGTDLREPDRLIKRIRKAFARRVGWEASGRAM